MTQPAPQKKPRKTADRLSTLVPTFHRMRRSVRHAFRRAMHRPRTVAESPNLLPLLIQALAAFSRANADALEEEIDSSLGFLRSEYPETVYSELRELFRQALNENHDVIAMAQKLSTQLTVERKIILGVQLYDLISKAKKQEDQLLAYYSFMSELGMASQAIDIVYQLNATETADPAIYQQGASPFESLCFGHAPEDDVILKGLANDERLLAFRYHDLILLKNQSARSVVVRGRLLSRGEFSRIYSGQRIIVDEQVLTYQGIVYYFNAKKNVSITQIYLDVSEENEVQLEKSRSRDSSIEIKFGLKVQVRALKKVDATFNGIALKESVSVEGTLEDKIVFHNDSELAIDDLRRRARALGARFLLKTHKSEYLVSNDASQLESDDILLSPGTSGDVLLKIHCNYEQRTGLLEVLHADRPILVGGLPVRNSAPLNDGDSIRIDAGQVLFCNFAERIIEEQRNVISTLEIRDFTYAFANGELGLDGISFNATRGEMICVMGASGSGKSTLMRALAGHLKPQRGSVLLNNQPFYANREQLKHYVTYIPQNDAFDEHLTIEENLDLAAAIRSPHLSNADRSRRIEGKLAELGLSERRKSVVGSPIKKTLSGGERKRLNIGLDMIGNADVFLFDEPTSGLSSKDAEHVIEIIRSMSHNKITMVTIHQPNSKLFQMFSKAMLLDKGGKLVFYGTPHEMLEYFANAEHQQQFGTDLGSCPACGATRPEFIFDVLETPLRDLSGDIIYEENSQGQLVPARRFSPDYWREKYESFHLLQDVKQVSLRRPAKSVHPAPLPRKRNIRWRDEWMQIKTLFRRAFLSKLRNRTNLFTTILEAPLLAAFLGVVLRYAESGHYTFASAFHIPTYIFIMLLVAMFLGLTNSADDIIHDRVVLQRERNLDVRLPYYIASKALTLALFAAVQSALFILIGNAILEIRGMFWIYFVFTFITAFAGLCIGLLISALVNDSKTAANIVPLILIPQLILGGALIKYQEMNKNLDLIYTIQRWFSTHPNLHENKNENALKVPLVCQFIPMRWSYEALVVAQAKMNPLSIRQREAQHQIDALVAIPKRTAQQNNRLDDLKDTLALLSGLTAKTQRDIQGRMSYIDDILNGAPLQSAKLRTNHTEVSAEQLFINQKISDLVAKAETEQSDYRLAHPINVFFGPKKYFHSPHPLEFVNQLRHGHFDPRLFWSRTKSSVFSFNAAMLLLFPFITLGLLHFALRKQLRS